MTIESIITVGIVVVGMLASALVGCFIFAKGFEVGKANAPKKDGTLKATTKSAAKGKGKGKGNGKKPEPTDELVALNEKLKQINEFSVEKLIR